MNSVTMQRMKWWWIAAMAAIVVCLSTDARATGGASAERAWINGAATLVTMAKSHTAEAGFQWEVEQSRERLREIVLQAGPHPTPQRKQLFVAMIMLNALLESASECHEGGVMVCPATLIWQLNAQVKTALAQLKAMGS